MDSRFNGSPFAADTVNSDLPAGSRILSRIEKALMAAADSISSFIVAGTSVDLKPGGNPVTEADRIADRTLRDILLQDGEGWLSEESADDLSRLKKDRLWVVDPIDGTREFVSKIPEWCISVAYVFNQRAVAGGILNPVTRELFLGSLAEGVTLNGESVNVSHPQTLDGAVVLASRSETARGDWDRYQGAPFRSRPIGSIAYKLALVAAGKADATWSSFPKNEWDVAAGATLVEAAGGYVRKLDGSEIRFNQRSPLLSGVLACAPPLSQELGRLLRK